MDLFEEMNANENAQKKNNNNDNKTKIIVLIAIIATVIIFTGVLIAMMYLNSSKMKFYVNGQAVPIQESYFQINDENNEIYISIQDMAKLLGVEYYNGEYGKNSEDTSKGYTSIENGEEIAIFEANTNKIYKVEKNRNEDEYSYMYLDETIKYRNNKLYTTPDGICKILNIVFEYNENISILSIDNLYTAYTSKINDYGYKSISDKYKNKKALKNNIIIAQKENGKYGVIKTDGTEIIGAKYDDIDYIENKGEFIVTSGRKVGIANIQGRPKINTDYDLIKVLDEDLGLYLVKKDEKYGVVDQNENIILHVEYDEIGVDTSLYKDNNIKNKYLLFENCIPVRKEEKWGIYNKGGKSLLPIEYDSIGCVVGTDKSRSTGNVVIVPDYEGIVVGRSGHYGVINSIGKELIPYSLDTIYSVTSEGKTIYKIEWVQNGTSYSFDIEKYFDARGIKKVNRTVEGIKEDDKYNMLSEQNSVNTIENEEYDDEEYDEEYDEDEDE